jgi:hypothetical protein
VSQQAAVVEHTPFAGREIRLYFEFLSALRDSDDYLRATLF